jgi:Anti-sigma factor N-terminus
MKKGIIMEIRRDVLIMMTPDGQFVNGKKVRNGHYAIGEEITFFPVKEGKRFISGYNWKSAAAILTAAILMITLFSVSFIQSNKAYAYVSVDINPSLELSLNRENQVIDITPYNEDGKVIIKKLKDWEKEDVSEVTEEILRLSEKLGYLKNARNVWITSTMTDSSDSSKHSALLNDLNSFVKQYNNMHSTEIIVNETTKDLREKALKKGITAGAFLKETIKSEQTKPVKPAGITPKDSEGEKKSADTNASPVEKEPQAPKPSKDHRVPEQKKAAETNSSSSKNKENSQENKGNERNKHLEPDHPSQKKHSDSGNNSTNGEKDNRERPENRWKNKSDNNGQSNREKGKGQGNSQRDQSSHGREKQHKDKNDR